jgi:hypothetical protein
VSLQDGDNSSIKFLNCNILAVISELHNLSNSFHPQSLENIPNSLETIILIFFVLLNQSFLFILLFMHTVKDWIADKHKIPV